MNSLRIVSFISEYMRVFYFFSILFFSGITSFSDAGETTQLQEYYLKAAFLEKFSRFTEWPPDEISDHFIITVIGKNYFGDALEKLKAKLKLKDRNIKLRYITDINDIGNTQILFVSNSEKENVERILAAVRGKPIMTVGDTQGFSGKGVQFNFYKTRENYIHFEVNLQAIRESRLNVSQYLLEFGKH